MVAPLSERSLAWQVLIRWCMQVLAFFQKELAGYARSRLDDAVASFSMDHDIAPLFKVWKWGAHCITCKARHLAVDAARTSFRGGKLWNATELAAAGAVVQEDAAHTEPAAGMPAAGAPRWEPP